MDFILSKVIWVFIAPGNFLVLLLLLSGFMCAAHSAKWQNIGGKLCFDIALLLFFLSIFPVGDWMLAPLENRFPPQKPDHVDGIILLGGDENPSIAEARGQPAVFDSARRYAEFVALAHDYPQAKLIYTGGSGLLNPDTKTTNAEVAKTALARLGAPTNRMLFEDQSRNTHENAVMTAALVHPLASQKWLLVTSAYHMTRAMACFRKAGWDVYPAPTGYMTTGHISSRLNFDISEHLLKMTMAAHEYYGLLAYWAAGYTATPWPK